MFNSIVSFFQHNGGDVMAVVYAAAMLASHLPDHTIAYKLSRYILNGKQQ